MGDLSASEPAVPLRWIRDGRSERKPATRDASSSLGQCHGGGACLACSRQPRVRYQTMERAANQANMHEHHGRGAAGHTCESIAGVRCRLLRHWLSDCRVALPCGVDCKVAGEPSRRRLADVAPACADGESGCPVTSAVLRLLTPLHNIAVIPGHPAHLHDAQPQLCSTIPGIEQAAKYAHRASEVGGAARAPRPASVSAFCCVLGETVCLPTAMPGSPLPGMRSGVG